MAKNNNILKLSKLQVALLNDENFFGEIIERFCF